MGRAFRPSDAQEYIARLTEALAANPTASTEELAAMTGVSKPTVRRYRKIVQGIGFPRRARMRFVVRGPRTTRNPRAAVRYEDVVVDRSPPTEDWLDSQGTRVSSDEVLGEESLDGVGAALLAEFHTLDSRVQKVLNSSDNGGGSVQVIPEMLPSQSEVRWRQWDARGTMMRVVELVMGHPDPWVRTLHEIRYRMNLVEDFHDAAVGLPVSDRSPTARSSDPYWRRLGVPAPTV
jgi:predicted DNA-binding transcriptional regulator AlpA